MSGMFQKGQPFYNTATVPLVQSARAQQRAQGQTVAYDPELDPASMAPAPAKPAYLGASAPPTAPDAFVAYSDQELLQKKRASLQKAASSNTIVTAPSAPAASVPTYGGTKLGS